MTWLLEFPMDGKEFIYFRKKLKKTQKQMAKLLGTSIKAIQSYEQGWRSVPVSVERQFFFLVSKKVFSRPKGTMSGLGI
jgi:transcriptional regulator with XRE-family HTH domain